MSRAPFTVAVTDEETGDPVSDALVCVSKGSEDYARGRSDENGRITVAGLTPGIYTVSAALPGYRGVPVRIRVLDGELSRGAVVLLPAR